MEEMEEEHDNTWDFLRDFDCKTGDEKQLLRGLKEICDNEQFLQPFSSLAPSDDSITKLVNIFCERDLRKGTAEYILQAIVPRTTFNAQHIEPLIFWLLSKYETSNSADTLLYWLTMLVEYKKVDIAPIVRYYSSLVRILFCHDRVVSACSLLIVITQPKYISKYIIKLVLHLYNLHYCNSSIAALLNLYKSFSSGLEDLKLPTSFNWPKPKIKSSIESLFRATKLENVSISGNSFGTAELPSTYFTYSKGKSVSEMLKGSLPAPWYRHKNSGQSKFTDISTMGQLGNKVDTLEIPSNTVSLLSNRIGFVLLMQRKDLEARFLVDIKWALEGGGVTTELLGRVVSLQEYISQGIPPVTSFLAHLLPVWDGLQYRQLILRLIPWIHFHTFEELCSDFLTPLMGLFVTAEVELKVEILNSLQSLITNMVVVHMQKAKLNIKPCFVDRMSDWVESPVQTLRQVVLFTEQFIKQGLFLETDSNRSNIIYLNEALTFYHTISNLEVKFGLPMWTVIPSYLAFNCLFTRNVSILSLLCSLLVRYKRIIVPYLESVGVLDKFEDILESINRTCQELVNFLWEGQVVTERHVCELLSGASRNEISRISRQMDLNKVFSVKQHGAIYSMVSLLALRANRNPQTLTNEEWMLFLQGFAEPISDFIKEYS